MQLPATSHHALRNRWSRWYVWQTENDAHCLVLPREVETIPRTLPADDSTQSSLDLADAFAGPECQKPLQHETDVRNRWCSGSQPGANCSDASGVDPEDCGEAQACDDYKHHQFGHVGPLAPLPLMTNSKPVPSVASIARPGSDN